MQPRLVTPFALVASAALACVTSQAVAQDLVTAEAAARLHRSVSSDGSVPAPATEGWSTSTSVAGFEGFAPELMADDSLAELGSEVETAEQEWALVGRQPGVAHVGRESVIGADSRVRVSGTTAYPAHAVVWITYTRGGSSYTCSGNLINANTVLTAWRNAS